MEEEKAEKLLAKDFRPEFIADLENDLKALKAIRDHWKKITRDPKWESFRDILMKTPQLKSGKIIIFTGVERNRRLPCWKNSRRS